jgi:Family of unknown function (DUF6370)
MKSVPVVLALWLLVSAAGAAEPAGSNGSSSKPPGAETKMKTKRGNSPNAAAPPGQVTLQGDLTCAKCGLHEATKCQSVLVVKEDGKDIKYYLAKNAVAAAEHEKVCGSSIPATVTGTVTDEAGHKVLTAKTVSVANGTKGGAENGAAPMPGHAHE